MKRIVKVKTTELSVIKSFTVDVSTFGDVVKQISDINFANKRVIVRENRTTLQSAEAKLPDGDITLYVYPENTKAGVGLDDMDFHQLRSACSKRGLPSAGLTKEELKKSLTEWFGNSENEAKGDAQVSSRKEGILETITSVQGQLESIYARVESLSDEQVSAYTLQELEEDMSSVANELGLKG